MFLVSTIFSRRLEEGETHPIDKEEEGDTQDGSDGDIQLEEDDEPSVTFALPVILLYCRQEIFLDPDPMNPNPPSLPPDLSQHLPLHLSCLPSVSVSLTQDSAAAIRPPDPLQSFYSSLGDARLHKLVTKLRAIHFSSYLHALQIMLTEQLHVGPETFLPATQICKQSTLSLDCTALIASLCRHSRPKLQQPAHGESECKQEEKKKEEKERSSNSCLPRPDILSELLRSATNSALSPPCVYYVNLPDAESSNSHCCQWEGEPELMFQTCLLEAGFEEVPCCQGYYWLRGENKTDTHMRGRRLQVWGESRGERKGERQRGRVGVREKGRKRGRVRVRQEGREGERGRGREEGRETETRGGGGGSIISF